MEREELGAWLRLSLTPGVGNSSARKLLAALGLPQTIFEHSHATLNQIVSSAQASALRSEPPELAELLDTTWAWLQGSGQAGPLRQIVALGDPDYPGALLEMEDPPLMLYLTGAASYASNSPPALMQQGQAAIDSIAQHLNHCFSHSLAVVGSRNPTPQGALNARHFSKALAQAGLTVVSGLALGVDGAAHEGALESLQPGTPALVTVAVVGTGLDRVYPKAHRDLAHRIAQHGVLVSEYPLGTPPLTANFPKRNRLIAGLTQGTLVIEAALKSGSLITARLAVEQGKEVFAIPGSIHSPQARGCHALIRQGAKLVESAQDVLEELRLERPGAALAAPDAGGPQVNKPAAPDDPLQAALGFDPVGLDALRARTGLDTANLQAQLMTLELEGRVARLPGGLFQRVTAS